MALPDSNSLQPGRPSKILWQGGTCLASLCICIFVFASCGNESAPPDAKRPPATSPAVDASPSSGEESPRSNNTSVVKPRNEPRQTDATAVPTSQPRAGFTGSASCKECHEEAYADWLDSHHGRAQRGIDPELDRSAFEPTRSIKHGNQTATAQTVDGEFVLETVWSDGEKYRFAPTGAIGVNPLWQYLIPADDGRVQVTELAFDPAEQEWFNVYGQEDRKHWEWGHWSQRGMNWNSMCAVCHMTAYDKGYDAEHDGYRSTYLEIGVGCEQCHGAMQAHLDWQAEHPDDPDDPSLPRLDRDEYMAICASCHARRTDLTGQFEVGDEFLDHFEPFMPDLTDTFYPDGQIWDEDFEYNVFSLSDMYAWGVRCVDCHNWHTGKVTTTENALCQRCHERGIGSKRPIDEVEHSHHPPDKEGFKCVDCHMPQTVYMARHWRHDHGMTIPDPLLTKEFGIPNACTRCHVEEGLQWSIDYVDQWYGSLMERQTRRRARLQARLKSGDPTAAGPLIEMYHEEDNPNWRAANVRFLEAALRSGDRTHMTRVLEFLPVALEDESPLVQSAALTVLEMLGPVLPAQLNLKLASDNRLVRIRSAWSLRESLDLDSQAGRDLIRHIKYRWDQPIGAFQWATLQRQRGDTAEALTWLKRAVAWDPRLSPARHEYATLLQQQDKPQQALEVLQEGLRYEPENGLYHYWLGLLYHELGQPGKALEKLRLAARSPSGDHRMWYNLAVAEMQQRNHEKALEAIDEAIAVAPRVAQTSQYLYTRVLILQQLGRLSQAHETAEELVRLIPRDPDARAVLQQIEQQLNRP